MLKVKTRKVRISAAVYSFNFTEIVIKFGAMTEFMIRTPPYKHPRSGIRVRVFKTYTHEHTERHKREEDTD